MVGPGFVWVSVFLTAAGSLCYRFGEAPIEISQWPSVGYAGQRMVIGGEDRQPSLQIDRLTVGDPHHCVVFGLPLKSLECCDESRDHAGKVGGESSKILQEILTDPLTRAVSKWY